MAGKNLPYMVQSSMMLYDTLDRQFIMKLDITLLLSFYLVVIPSKPQSSDQKGSYHYSLHSTALSDKMSNHPDTTSLCIQKLEKGCQMSSRGKLSQIEIPSKVRDF